MQSLQHLHTFSLPTSCNDILTFDSVNSLTKLLESLHKSPYIILGEGSNTVFTEDYCATVLLNRIKGITIKDDKTHYLINVGAGENWHQLVEHCLRKGIGGFENLALIPGTVGAAPIQNIGAYGVEIERFIFKVEYLDTFTMTKASFSREECAFGYRDSVFKNQKQNERIITSVIFKLPKQYKLETSYSPLNTLKTPSAFDIFEQVIRTRNEKLPKVSEFGNAGSFFKNPVVNQHVLENIKSRYPKVPVFKVEDSGASKHTLFKIPAAWLIDQLGFKGKELGGIACYKNQPLVLVNLGRGTGAELLLLAREIRDSVKATFNITLENEVRLIGKEGLLSL
ncbi:UDP-N-acetylmuramate dehydrogenase [Glaciecola sp. 2405UD65-10]|uniref:UDP-N-acetylmuramate dehydrogenase n=1 Tax=Glaciecola sp. 2405UD65-10 TaxID=3397244 RepID=UPI003B5C6092